MFRLFTLLPLFSLLASTVAQTPDSLTPANEDICDELIGGTPGLYGLCVAYCEAQDLNDNNVSDPLTNAKNVPNKRILLNYDKKKTDTDPDMPCVKPICPCWEQSELDKIHTRTFTLYDYDHCEDLTHYPYYEYYYTNEYGYNTDYNWSQSYAQVINYYPDGPYSTYGMNCYYYEYDSQISVYRSFQITPEEYDSCKESVQARSENAGLTCHVANY